ncbi:hypothetical protein L8X33_08645, partial [Campylobacter sp. CNRCH_2014_2849]|uniref:hypothetical protein n=1 Tax=Campylobacter sp. CNRCH_2014_2849 TaxID=2911604 RepID=UPI0021E6A34D
ICFGIVIISPFVYSILIKSDDFRWLLYPIQWLFNIDTHTINDISILIIGFCSLSIISFFIIGFFIKYIN